jgi:gluconokinase
MHGTPAFLISVDIGTSSTKAILYEIGGEVVAEDRAAYRTYYPESGWVEQDPDEILAAVLAATKRLVAGAGVRASSVAALVFGGIWHSLLPVDAEGRPLCRATTWADLRSVPQNEALRSSLDSEAVKEKTGCTLHPMYFLSRLQWLREEAPEIFRRADRFVSIKEYVLFRLFGTRLVDQAMASGTGLWNMRSMDWDGELLSQVGLTRARFSECVEPATILPGLHREYAEAMGLAEGTPGVIGAADGALAHLGAVGLSEERMSLSVGTSVALRLRTASPRAIRGSEAWCYYLAEGNWLVGGVLHDGGNTLTWLADRVFGAASAGDEIFDEMSRMAGEVPPGAEGLFFLPFFGGERSPHYHPEAKGTLHGLSFNHTRGHMVRALMEGLAYCMASVYRTLSLESSPEPVVTGGILKSSTWLGIVADFLGKTLWLPGVEESAAWGGVILGLKAVGVYPSLAGAASLVRTAGKLEPDPGRSEVYRELMTAYDELYARLYAAGH